MMQRSRSLSFAKTEIEMHSSSRSSPRDGASQGEGVTSCKRAIVDTAI